MTSDELVILINNLFRGLTNYIVPEDIEAAIEQALRDTGWSLPVSGSFKEQWLIQRTKRHLYDMLRAGSAHKFKVEGINLQQRFEHYNILIRDMDEDFETAVQDNPAEFAGVDLFKMFGSKVDAGFSYDDYGRDTTYSDDNQVVFTPKETD